MTAASPQALVIAALARHLPADTRRELRQMLANSIAAPTPAEFREARLGLLLELLDSVGVAHATGESYEALRADRRAATAESWPSRSQLSRAYGNWMRALEAASKLIGEAGPGAPGDHANRSAPRLYTRRDLLTAIERCRLVIGTWPSRSTYARWTSLAIRNARRHGRTDPAIPSVSAIIKRFGTWTRAVELAAGPGQARNGDPRNSDDGRESSRTCKSAG